MNDDIDFEWNFHHDMSDKSYVQEYENLKLKKQLELAVKCISDLRNLGFHNEVVKVTADLTNKQIKEIEDNKEMNLHRFKGYGWSG